MQGHIRKRVHQTRAGKETVRWYVVLSTGVDSAGRRQQKWHGGFSTRKEAEAVRAKLVSDMNRGVYVFPTSTTLRDWVKSWLDSVKDQLKPSTLHSYRRNLELHVLPKIGHLQLKAITAPVLNSLYLELGASGNKYKKGGLSAKTVRYIHTVIHKCLSDAIDAELLGANAADRAKPPRANRSASTSMNFWTAEELAAFLRHVHRARLEHAWRLAAMTGMRRGEVLGLRWSDIDFKAGRVAIRTALVSVDYKIVPSTPKTHQARVIDLDPATVQALREQRERGCPQNC